MSGEVGREAGSQVGVWVSEVLLLKALAGPLLFSATEKSCLSRVTRSYPCAEHLYTHASTHVVDRAEVCITKH